MRFKSFFCKSHGEDERHFSHFLLQCGIYKNETDRAWEKELANSKCKWENNESKQTQTFEVKAQYALTPISLCKLFCMTHKTITLSSTLLSEQTNLLTELLSQGVV